MWPRTYGLRLSLSLLVRFKLSPAEADAPEELFMVSIDVRNLRCCARGRAPGAGVDGCSGRWSGLVSMRIRAERQEPRRLY